MGRLKQILTVLVVILVADVIYMGYLLKKNHKPGTQLISLKSLGLLTRHQRLKTLQQDDIVLSPQQASHIIDTNELQIAVKVGKNNTQAKDTSVVFIKTHKTASSTLQNILLRYAILHNLTVPIPIYRASFLWPATFSTEFVRQGGSSISKYNILAHHAIFNKKEMDKIMQPNPVYVTILRNATSLFASAYTYFRMGALCFKQTLSTFRLSPYYDEIRSSGLCPKNKMPVRNLQALDLGLLPSEMDDMNSIKKMISYLDETIDVVLIMERFEDSLLLLGKKLNWSVEDLIYFTQNAQDKGGESLVEHFRLKDPDLQREIREFNMADSLIYEHFSKKLDDELSKAFTKNELRRQKKYLNRLNEDYYRLCVARKTSDLSEYRGSYSFFRPYGDRTLGYILKKDQLHNVKCRLLALPEIILTHYLKSRLVHNMVI